MLFVLASVVGVDPSRLLPDKELVSPPGILDEELSRMPSLGEDVRHWLQRVISSGMTQEVGNE